MLTPNKWAIRILLLTVLFSAMSFAAGRQSDLQTLEEQFRNLPMESRRLTGPLFWLHGTETREELEQTLERVAEGGNGSFTAESRPHNDWLAGAVSDLDICLAAAKKYTRKCGSSMIPGGRAR